LPVGEPLGERAVRGGKIGDQLAYLAALLVRDDNGFGGTERQVGLVRMASA